MKWGLVPSFTKKTEKPDHFKMFNARSESVSEKASFRRLLPKNRCLVAVEGFYEWKKDGSKKQPYYIHLKNNRPLVFAGLYDFWSNSEGEVLATFTILTTSSSSKLQWLHDRMPVIFGNQGSADAWLSGSAKVGSSCVPYNEPDLMWYPVTPAMGAPSFNGPDCIKEVPLKGQDTNSIAKFFSKKTVKDSGPMQSQSKASIIDFKEGELKRKGKFENEEDDEGLKSDFIFSSYDASHKLDSKRKHGAALDHEEDAKSARDKQQPTLFTYYGKT